MNRPVPGVTARGTVPPRQGKLHRRNHFVTSRVARACRVAPLLLGSAAPPGGDPAREGHGNGAEMKDLPVIGTIHPGRPLGEAP
jgi:hypothetical protein